MSKVENLYTCCACLQPKSYSDFYSNHAITKKFPKCKMCTKEKNPQINKQCRKCNLIKPINEFNSHDFNCKECYKERLKQIYKLRSDLEKSYDCYYCNNNFPGKDIQWIYKDTGMLCV